MEGGWMRLVLLLKFSGPTTAFLSGFSDIFLLFFVCVKGLA